VFYFRSEGEWDGEKALTKGEKHVHAKRNLAGEAGHATILIGKDGGHIKRHESRGWITFQSGREQPLGKKTYNWKKEK